MAYFMRIKKSKLLFALNAFFFGRFGIIATVFELHHKPVLLAGFFKNLHGLLKIVRVCHLDLNHGSFTILYLFLMRRYYNIVSSIVNEN